MKILITGMTGFVGAAVTKKLFGTDHEIIGLVRSKENLPDEIKEKYKIITADISKKVPDIECDMVIHTAATVSEKVLSFFMNKTNVDGTRRVLEATGNAKFIYISSGSVYNITQETHYENESINPKLLTPYGRSKLLGENVLNEEFAHRDSIVLRPRMIYGHGDRVILPRLLKIYKDGVITTPGDLNQTISMTNIDFFSDVIVQFINQGFTGQEIYNVTDKYEYNLRKNLTGLFGTLFDRQIEVRSLNETFLRIIAGLKTVLVPGNQFTQTSIDVLTRDHYLSTEKLQKRFPNLTHIEFNEYLPTYVKWITDIGINRILGEENRRIVWS